MTLAVDITDGCGLSNEPYRELLPKQRVVLYLPFIKAVYPAVHYQQDGVLQF